MEDEDADGDGIIDALGKLTSLLRWLILGIFKLNKYN